MNDRDLVKLFHDQREADKETTPSFERMWSTARADLRRKQRLRLLRYAVAAGLLLTIGLSWQSFINPPEAASITTWQSPTNGLLQQEDNEPLQLVTPPPRVIVSISDWRSPTDSLLERAAQETSAPSQ